MKAVILAGGSGSRLWPLSRKMYPKHLLNLSGNLSLFQLTLNRTGRLVQPQDTITITNIDHFSMIKMQIDKLDNHSNIIIEPQGKNTAPAIACALKYFKESPDDIVIILPSDHMINDFAAFEKSINNAVELAKNNYIVTLGVKPSYPETGFGYIKTNDKYLNGYLVENFTEKPDLKTAEDFVKSSDYYWNCGMFVSKISVLTAAFKQHAPEICANLSDNIFENQNKIRYSVYENMPSVSFDYAIMEKYEKIACVPLLSDWNDLGSWKSLYDMNKKDENGNVIRGNVKTFDTKNSFAYSSKDLIVMLGLDDVIAVGTEDATLICNKEYTQDIRKVYEYLKANNNNTYYIHKTVYRPWGYYTCLNSGEGYLTKEITVSPHSRLSYQSHEHRSEHWVVLQGTADVLLEDNLYNLKIGQSIDIPIKAKHSLQNNSDNELKIIEVQRGNYISEDDILRYNDIYGRV